MTVDMVTMATVAAMPMTATIPAGIVGARVMVGATMVPRTGPSLGALPCGIQSGVRGGRPRRGQGRDGPLYCEARLWAHDWHGDGCLGDLSGPVNHMKIQCSRGGRSFPIATPEMPPKAASGGPRQQIAEADMAQTDGKPKKRFASWLLWWQIDQAQLEKQVAQYNTLRFFSSIRGQAVCCLLLSIALTAVFVSFGITPLSASVDAGLMAVLAVFIYFGHRWAMITAMVLWTADKGLSFIDVLGGPGSQLGRAVIQVIWWCTYMHAFYFAVRVEQERRKLATSP